MTSTDVLISAERIKCRVKAMADEISADYHGREIVVVGVLNGAFVFVADLVRELQIPVTIDFLRVSSYGAATETSGVVQIRKDLDFPVADCDLLLVEDIVDTALTVAYLHRHLRIGRPRSLRVCTLLDKRHRRQVPFTPDYVGFEIDDEFVVGYGLDFNEQYRQLADICVLRESPGET